MKSSLLYQKLFLLPGPLRQEVLDFIEFLIKKHHRSQEATLDLSIRRKQNFGRLKGKIVIKPGFDGPIEGFEAYS